MLSILNFWRKFILSMEYYVYGVVICLSLRVCVSLSCVTKMTLCNENIDISDEVKKIVLLLYVLKLTINQKFRRVLECMMVGCWWGGGWGKTTNVQHGHEYVAKKKSRNSEEKNIDEKRKKNFDVRGRGRRFSILIFFSKNCDIFSDL